MENENELIRQLRETRDWTPDNWVLMSLKSAKLMFDAADEIDALRKERDEARQIACNREAELNRMMFDNPKYADSEAIAAQRGWDCFKEAL